jgi:hypothetical protein
MKKIVNLMFRSKFCKHVYLIALQIEWRNNRLELQSDSNVALIDELDKLLELLQIPPEVCILLTCSSPLYFP